MRQISRAPRGQSLRSTRPVSSATQAPSRGDPSASSAGFQRRVGSERAARHAQRAALILTERVQQPRDRRMGSDPPEQIGLVGQSAEV